MNRTYALGQIMALALTVSPTTAGTVRLQPDVWKTECVGRMKISMPGDVDVATSTQKDLRVDEYPLTTSFIDGQSIGQISYGYRGTVNIFHGVTESQTEEILGKFAEIRARILTNEKKLDLANEDRFTVLDISPQKVGDAFESQNRPYATIKLNDAIFQWEGYRRLNQTEQRHDFIHLMKNLTSRDTYSIPDAPGICLPYSFIADAYQAPAFVSMGFRLRRHPDITIIFSETSQTENDAPITERIVIPDREIDEFWSDFSREHSRERVISIWKSPTKRHVQFGGQNGSAAFMRISRRDSTADFGYTAVVRGDPTSPLDHPDLALYIIQANANARAKGFVPLTEKEFLAMAERIAQSIRPHFVESR